MKYIDADKLIAEIEALKHRKGFLSLGNTEITEAYMARGVQFTCDDIVNLIRSLQQERPEEDLEKFDKEVTKIWGRCAAEPNDSIACLHIETFIEVVRHFYELGLNTGKEK